MYCRIVFGLETHPGEISIASIAVPTTFATAVETAEGFIRERKSERERERERERDTYIYMCVYIYIYYIYIYIYIYIKRERERERERERDVVDRCSRRVRNSC